MCQIAQGLHIKTIRLIFAIQAAAQLICMQTLIVTVVLPTVLLDGIEKESEAEPASLKPMDAFLNLQILSLVIVWIFAQLGIGVSKPARILLTP